MDTLTHPQKDTAPGGVSRGPRSALYLSLWLLGVLVFMLVIGPLMTRLPAMATMGDFIDERGIEANAYYYTEVELFSEANLFMENTMDYLPAGDD